MFIWLRNFAPENQFERIKFCTRYELFWFWAFLIEWPIDNEQSIPDIDYWCTDGNNILHTLLIKHYNDYLDRQGHNKKMSITYILESAYINFSRIHIHKNRPFFNFLLEILHRCFCYDWFWWRNQDCTKKMGIIILHTVCHDGSRWTVIIWLIDLDFDP